MIRFICLRLLRGNDVVELHAYRSLCLCDGGVIRVGNKYDFHELLQLEDCFPGIPEWFPIAHRISKLITFLIISGNMVVIEDHSQRVTEDLAVGAIFFLDVAELDFFPFCLQRLWVNISKSLSIQALCEEVLNSAFPVDECAITIKSNGLWQCEHSEHSANLLCFNAL